MRSYPGSHLLFVIAVSLSFLCVACPQFEEPTDDNAPSNTNQPTTNQNNHEVPEDLLCEVELEFTQAQDADTVAVAGPFNDWALDADEMDHSGNAWRHSLELEPGHHPFKYVIDGAFEADPPPFVYTHWSGDSENRNLVVDDCSRPSFDVEYIEIDDQGRVSAELQFLPGVDGDSLDADTLQITLGDLEIDADVDDHQISVDHELDDFGKFSFRARAADEEGRPTLQNPLWIPLWHEEQAFDWFDAIIYLIFTDRFRQAGSSPLGPIDGVPSIANYKGGNFPGITEAIEEDHFHELGVNALWLNPINENTNLAQSGSFDDNVYTGYHGYWTVDPLRAETRFGDIEQSGDEALHEMIEAAHDRGIRVIFDLVLNHIHEDHIYCQENPTWCEPTCVCGDQGCGWDEQTLICQFAPYLPNLNYRNHDIVERVVDDAMALIEKFDVDALRIDAAKHMEHVIMRTIRLRINELEQKGAAPFYIVGETFTGEFGHDVIMDYVADWELHGQFDFPLLYPIRRTFGQDASFEELETGLERSEDAYGETYPWHSPFLGNHDIPRFVTEMVGNDDGPFGNTQDLMADGPENSIDQQWIIDRLSMAHAFLLTIPGIPLLYYGDEIGLAGGPDPDNRRMMSWDWNANQTALLENIRELGQLRGDVPALRTGDRRELWIDHDFYAYSRDDGEGRRALIAMNKSEDQRTETVILPEDWSDSATLSDHLSAASVDAEDGEVQITLDSWQYAIFDVVE